MKLINFLKSRQNIFYWLAFALGLTFLIFLQYFGLIYYHYPVPPGHDAAMHWNMAQPFFNGEINLIEYIKSGSYPPGFLILISNLAHRFNTDTLNIMLWITPAIIVLAAVVLFFLTKIIWGKSAALISFFLYSFATTINIQQLNDGGYPNLMASQILLPFGLLLGIILVQNNKLYLRAIIGILLSLTLLAIPLTHHIATLYLFAILILFVPGLIIFFWINNKWPTPKGLSSILILLLFYIVSFYALTRISIFASAFGLLGSTIKFTSISPFFRITGHVDPEAVISFMSLPSYIGYSILIFGALGIFALPCIYGKIDKNKLLPILFISIWATLLLIGSRLNFLSNPDRLARDAVYPLAILAGALISYLLKWLWQEQRWWFTIILVVILLLTAIPAKRRVQTAFRYEPMVRITNADMEAINYLKTQPLERILIESYAFYFERFLPNKQITYLWISQTEQPNEAHLLDPNNTADLARLENFDYIYTVESQQGWVPKAVQLGGTDKLQNNSHFQQVGHYTSKTNEIYLFKILH